jgi:hypothetical protein
MRLFLSLAVCCLTALPVAAGELTVGFGEADVTPALGKKPVYMAGFGHGREARRVHDPIMVRAVVLSDGDAKVALVSVDVVGLFLHSVERVREALPGFKYVLVSATHNHEGPDTLGLWGPNPLKTGVDPEYLKRVEAGCVAAVKAADKARVPAVAKIGAAADANLLHDNRLPVVKLDELVAVRFEEPKTGKAIGVLVQWNCHPEVLDSKNTEVTADFPHYTVKHLKESQGCPVVYFTGAVGGLMTTLKMPLKDAAGKELADGTFEKAERYGTLVGQLADGALKNAKEVTLTPFDVRPQTILVPVENKLYHLGWQLGTLDRTMYAWDGTPTPKEFTTTKDITKPIAVKSEIGYLKLGDLEVAVVPGEIYPELVLGKVQEPTDPGADFPDAPAEPGLYPQLKGKHRMLIGLGNDELGYFIPKRQWDAKSPYCYGLKKAQYGEENSVGPEAAGIICGVFKELVNRK